MVKIKKEGNYIVVLDELDNEIFNAPANKTFFKVDNNRISLSSDFNNRSDVEKVSFNIDEVLDSLGVSMVNPLLWLRDNTGFSTASGGSDAVVADILSIGGIRYAASVNGSNIFLTPVVHTITTIIFTGASIMEQWGGRSLTVANSVITTAFQNAGMNVQVYVNGWSGEDLDGLKTPVDQAIAAFPNPEHLHIFHGGGNNVSATRPYGSASATELTTFADDYDEILTKYSTAGVPISPVQLSFRSYADPTTDFTIFNNQELGSQPYNTNIILPRIPNNQKTPDGNSIYNLYDLTRNDQEIFLQSDGIHLSAAGNNVMQNMFIEGVKHQYFNGSIPTEITPDPANPVGAVEGKIILALGSSNAATDAGQNPIAIPTNGTNFSRNGLKNLVGEVTDINVVINVNGTAGTSNVGNTNGQNFGETSFDNTLENNLIYGRAIYIKTGNQIDIELSGFPNNDPRDILICGTRAVTAQQRETLITSHDGKTVSYNTTVSPPEAPKILVGVVPFLETKVNPTDPDVWRVTLSVTTQLGDFAYVSGIEFDI